MHFQGWKFRSTVAKSVSILHTNKIVFFPESSSTALKTFIKSSTCIKPIFTVLYGNNRGGNQPHIGQSLRSRESRSLRSMQTGDTGHGDGPGMCSPREERSQWELRRGVYSFLWLLSQINHKPKHIYYLTVLLVGLTGTKSKCWPGCFPSGLAMGRIHFPPLRLLQKPTSVDFWLHPPTSAFIFKPPSLTLILCFPFIITLGSLK